MIAPVNKTREKRTTPDGGAWPGKEDGRRANGSEWNASLICVFLPKMYLNSLKCMKSLLSALPGHCRMSVSPITAPRYDNSVNAKRSSNCNGAKTQWWWGSDKQKWRKKPTSASRRSKDARTGMGCIRLVNFHCMLVHISIWIDPYPHGTLGLRCVRCTGRVGEAKRATMTEGMERIRSKRKTGDARLPFQQSLRIWNMMRLIECEQCISGGWMDGCLCAIFVYVCLCALMNTAEG